MQWRLSIIHQLKLEEKKHIGEARHPVYSTSKEIRMEKDNRSWVENWGCKILCHSVFWWLSFALLFHFVFLDKNIKHFPFKSALLAAGFLCSHRGKNQVDRMVEVLEEKHVSSHGERVWVRRLEICFCWVKIWCWPHHWHGCVWP